MCKGIEIYINSGAYKDDHLKKMDDLSSTLDDEFTNFQKSHDMLMLEVSALQYQYDPLQYDFSPQGQTIWNMKQDLRAGKRIIDLSENLVSDKSHLEHDIHEIENTVMQQKQNIEAHKKAYGFQDPSLKPLYENFYDFYLQKFSPNAEKFIREAKNKEDLKSTYTLLVTEYNVMIEFHNSFLDGAKFLK
ncbi:MAG: hypothetical protein WCJ84_02385 [Candidatus Peregrinibacteria bacterium]